MIAFFRGVWYSGDRKEQSFSAASIRQAVGPLTGGSFCPLIFGKGGCPMVTYSDLIQTGILVVGIIALFIQANKKK